MRSVCSDLDGGQRHRNFPVVEMHFEDNALVVNDVVLERVEGGGVSPRRQAFY
jgi:hypothetical protein